jgi:hypothetical protein
MPRRLPIARLPNVRLANVRLCLRAVAACFAIPAFAMSAVAEPAAPSTAAPVATAALSAKDSGARYGQALGAIEICHGSKVTDKAEALPKSFSGADQEAFKAQAAKIYDAWHKVKNCSDSLDPNKCKIIMDKSCATAEAEIGSSGTVMPGLVEFMKR